MIERSARRLHLALQRVPGLRRFDAWAVDFWFRLRPLERLAEIGLCFRLGWHALRRGRRLTVLCRFGGIGDILCSLPAAHAYAQAHPQRAIVYVTRPAYRPLIERSALGLPCFTVGHHILPSAWPSALVEQAIDLSYADESGEREPVPEPLMQRFARDLGVKSIDESIANLRVDRTKVAAARARHLPSPKTKLILIHAGPTWRVREWPLEKWSELAQVLQRDPNLHLLQIVADRNVTVKDPRCATIPGIPGVKVSDDMNQLIDLIAAADLLIGIESGPLHIAQSVGTPAVALFGPTKPELFLWPGRSVEAVVHLLACSFCHHRKPRLHWQTGCPFDIACLHDLPVAQVDEKVRASLLKSPHRSVAS